jgi:hypothetical protein
METNFWAALSSDEQTKMNRKREKIHTVRPAGLKPRRSFSYTTTLINKIAVLIYDTRNNTSLPANTQFKNTEVVTWSPSP